MCVCVCVYVCVCVCVRACVRACVQWGVSACVYTYTCMHVRVARVHVCRCETCADERGHARTKQKTLWKKRGILGLNLKSRALEGQEQKTINV